MLGHENAIATIAVRNVAAAKKFYEGTLGLEPVPNGQAQAPLYRSGKSQVLVYQSEYAGTNKATAATWEVAGDLESVVKELRSRGVRFEHYELPGLTLAGDVHVGHGLKTAWFKDPDGNILALVGH